jgi:predicted metal-binding protein
MAGARAEIVACETCGNSQRDAAGRTRGEYLLEHLRAALAAGQDIDVDVQSVRCLWACTRSCAVLVRSPRHPGYVIAGLEPTEVSARALLDYAALYAASADGAVPYKQWPVALKGHFLCRIPKSTDVFAPNPEESASVPQEKLP